MANIAPSCALAGVTLPCQRLLAVIATVPASISKPKAVITLSSPDVFWIAHIVVEAELNEAVVMLSWLGVKPIVEVPVKTEVLTTVRVCPRNSPSRGEVLSALSPFWNLF